jgi:hypothetical protein
MAALEAQRAVLGNAVEPALEALQAQIDALEPAEDATEDQRKQIIAECGIAEIPVLSEGSDEELQRALDATSITSYSPLCMAGVSTRTGSL